MNKNNEPRPIRATSDATSALFCDLYELTMAAGYHARGINGRAVFTVYVRGNARRGYFVAAGLENLIAHLREFRFTAEDIAFLQTTGRFTPDFLQRLTHLRFFGDVHAMGEGTVFFPDQPLLEIDAPLIEGQLLETFVLNAVGFQTLIATKAARCVRVAGGRPLIDFSLRRTHGLDAGMKVARSSYIAGFDATSNVLAGREYGIPISGTMAHSYISAFESELTAFNAYADQYPDQTVLLIDTYDVATGARNAVKTAQRLRDRGHALIGVRLDSGDMIEDSRRVRRIFDAAGFPSVKIFASSGFDEYRIADAIRRGAAIDAFGVGTRMGVSADRPYLDIVYKLVQLDDQGLRKKSAGKATLAGAKQVFRHVDPDSKRFTGDIIGLRGEDLPGTLSLLKPVMVQGEPVGPAPPLSALRERCRRQVEALEERYAAITDPAPNPVRRSLRLKALQEDVDPVTERRAGCVETGN